MKKNAKNTKKGLLLIIISIALILSMVVSAFAATSSISNWWLLDSGGHLDWDGSTTYQTQFNSSVTRWNNYKSGVIRADTALTVCDVTISDFNEVSNIAGMTYESGLIKFNQYLMNGYTSVKKNFVCTHELGHALGLAHNQSGDIMYKAVSSYSSLSENDKLSYNVSYFRVVV